MSISITNKPGQSQIPAAQTLYVNGERTDTYVANGTYYRPFKTIQEAVNQVIANGDNSTKPYNITIVGVGSYTAVTLDNASLYDLAITGAGQVSIASISSTTNNSNLSSLQIVGASIGYLTIQGATNNSGVGGQLVSLRNCTMNLACILSNIVNATLNQCSFLDTISIENVDTIEFETCSITGSSIAITTNLSNPIPYAGFPGSFAIMQGGVSVAPTVTIDTLSALQLRDGTRLGTGSSTLTADGFFQSYSSYIRGNIAITATGYFQNLGSFYDPSLLTITSGGTLDNATTSSKIINYTPTSPGNWSPVPTEVSGALDTLAGLSHAALTLTAVGSTPSANGASLSGQALTLQPADGTHPGLLTTGAQTIAGAKTFSGGVTATVTGTASGNTTITPTNHAVVVSSASNTLSTAAPSATSGVALVSNGSSADPSFGTVAIAGGGTGQTTKAAAFDALSPMTTSGDIVYGGTSGTGTRLPKGSDGQVLTLASGLPTWAASSGSVVYAPATVQRFTSGSGTYNKSYTFNIASGSATAGATYTNNSITYTVSATVSSATQVVMTGSGAPTSSGTLTKASGTGDATLTFTSVAAPLYLKVRMVGGGGGGGADGSSGNDGFDTTFGTSLLAANHGRGGAQGQSPGAGTGGTISVLSPAINVASMHGGRGGGGSTAVFPAPGGLGGSSPFGGAGGGGDINLAGYDAEANSGSGGGGGSSATNRTGGGGGAGGYVEALLYSPSATYSYAVGAGGTGGSAGSGNAGGLGGSGVIIVEEFYQ